MHDEKMNKKLRTIVILVQIVVSCNFSTHQHTQSYIFMKNMLDGYGQQLLALPYHLIA